MSENTFDERFELSDQAKSHIIYDEHIVRYEFAKEFVRDRTVLEIACGSGYGSNMLVEAEAKKVIAMDIDKVAVKKAQEKYKNNNLIFKVGDAENIDLPDDSVDILVSFETIEHLKNPEKFLSEAKRVLRDDGIALISTPNVEVSKNKNPYHIFEYSQNEFENVLCKQFAFVDVLYQGNGIASMIDLGARNNKVYKTTKSKPLFFVAICSEHDDVQLPDRNFVSLNSEALHSVYNNPAVRLVNGLYSTLIKVPGFKKMLKRFS